MPQAVFNFKNTKYRPPKEGGGLPTTKTLTLSSFIQTPSNLRLPRTSTLIPQYQIGGLLRDHQGRRVGVRRGHRREHRGVDDAEFFDPMHAQTGIDDRIGDLRTHAAGADRMIDGCGTRAKIRE